MKKIRGDKPIEVIIYIEISQGNFLHSYLYLKQAKITFFSFFHLQNQRTGGWNRSCPVGDLVPVGGGRWQGKEVGG
jgi:hypothetical protein